MIFIGVGSSIGDAEAYFSEVKTFLETSGIKVVAQSKLLKNPPQGGVAQNEFTNAVWQLEFPESTWEQINWILLPQSRRLRLKAYKLLRLLRKAENNAQRNRDVKWADRTLDLDILQFHSLILKRKNLTIPHPLIKERDFVLKPWQELVEPDYEILGLGRIKDLIEKLSLKH